MKESETYSELGYRNDPTSIKNASPCCGIEMILDDIYLVTKRDDGTSGRKVIGNVLCCFNKKHKGLLMAVGRVKPVYEYRGNLNPEAWRKMKLAHHHAPFYFIEKDRVLIPESK
jgi:hypothetical protein